MVDGSGPVTSSGDVNVTPLGTPAWDSSTKAGNASVHLAWTTVVGATDYEVFDRDVTQNGNFTDVQSVAPGTGSLQTADVTALTNGDNYQFYIEAANDSGASATTLMALTPSATA